MRILGKITCLECLIYGPMFLVCFIAIGTRLLSLNKELVLLRVSGHFWERTINIETYKTVSNSDWKENIPLDATLTGCMDANRIIDESTVRAPLCNDEVIRWAKGDWVTANGHDDDPQWPTPTIKACDKVELGCQRQGARHEVYSLRLVDSIKDKIHTCNVSYPVWKTTPVGTRVEVKFDEVLWDSDCAQMKHLP